MKFLTLIFSFYLLALSIVPCSDAFNSGQTNKETITFSASHDHPTDTADFCSSFCICNCCTSPVISKSHASYLAIPAIKILPEQKFVLRKLSFISVYTGNVWHPPQFTA